jgi:hypothetical protein
MDKVLFIYLFLNKVGRIFFNLIYKNIMCLFAYKNYVGYFFLIKFQKKKGMHVFRCKEKHDISFHLTAEETGRAYSSVVMRSM